MHAVHNAHAGQQASPAVIADILASYQTRVLAYRVFNCETASL
jgi:hypothetical protein